MIELFDLCFEFFNIVVGCATHGPRMDGSDLILRSQKTLNFHLPLLGQPSAPEVEGTLVGLTKSMARSLIVQYLHD